MDKHVNHGKNQASDHRLSMLDPVFCGEQNDIKFVSMSEEAVGLTSIFSVTQDTSDILYRVPDLCVNYVTHLVDK